MAEEEEGLQLLHVEVVEGVQMTIGERMNHSCNWMEVVCQTVERCRCCWAVEEVIEEELEPAD